jgi:hypothetical protein
VEVIMLDELIATHRADLIAQCEHKSRARLAVADSPRVSCVPLFLDQLVEELQRTTLIGGVDITESARQHGYDLLTQGFTVSQLVHEYGDICQAITELAVKTNAQIRADDFRCLNRCLDDAIAGAATEYGRAHDEVITLHADVQDQRRLGLTTKLRTAIATAKLARDIVKTGRVGVAGSTSDLLDMSLSAAHGLADSLIDEFSTERSAIAPVVLKS